MNNYQNHNRGSSSTLTLTQFDVLGGRGKGVHSHPGNINFRKLVFVNKGLYDNCPEPDKIKISRGIVSAVHHLGGRFLKFDKRKNKYREIDDNKAREKTSQALRDARSGKVCETSLYMASINSATDSSDSSNPPPAASKRIPEQAYFGYSVQVLEALFNPNYDDSHASLKFSPDRVPPVAGKEAAAPPLQTNSEIALAPQYPLDMAIDQFPSALRGKSNCIRENLTRGTSLTLSSLSLRSTLSISECTEKFFGTLVGGDRHSAESILTQEIRELIRYSDSRLRQVDEMDDDGLFPEEENPNQEDKDSSRSSDLSKPSVMDESVMTFDVIYDNLESSPFVPSTGGDKR